MLNDYTIPNSDFINLTEESQRTSVRYALGIIKDNGVTNITPWFLCRDYFNDFILYNQWFVENKDKKWPPGHTSIYGYNYSNSKEHDWTDVFLLVDLKNYTLNKEILIEEFSKYESYLGTNTKFDFLGESKLVVIVPDVYKNNHVIFAWYTFILRYCINVAVGEYKKDAYKRPNDLHYTDRNIFFYKEYNSHGFISNESKSLLEDEYYSLDKFLKGVSKLPHKYFLDKIVNNKYDYYAVHNTGFIYYLVNVFLKGGF